MTSRTANFCMDCSDPIALATWWDRAVDDFTFDPDSTDEEAWLTGPLGRELIFLKVPEAKTVKNRMHICLRPVDVTRDEEIERLLGLGASMVNDLRQAESWAVLADPEGNEFCVLEGPADERGVLKGRPDDSPPFVTR